MNPDYLEFEQPIAELEARIDALRHAGLGVDVSLVDEVERLQGKIAQLTRKIFGHLSATQIVQLARHPLRPHALDYIEALLTDFDELHGDRHFGDGPAMVAGIGRFEGQPVAFIGHEKGRTTKEKIKRNFGMTKPEGYRKALRVMKLAERFQLPILTFIDTPGAYPGVGAEERNQSEAIARNLLEMITLKTPIIATVIGEGGSGGALAIGVGDRLLMLQYAVYSVISPEGCASILWKSATRAPDAAEALGLTAERLLALGLIDTVVPEPLGGAHRDIPAMADQLRQVLAKQLADCQRLPIETLCAQRYDRFRAFGAPT